MALDVVVKTEILMVDYTYMQYTEIILICGEYKGTREGLLGFILNVSVGIGIQHVIL